MNIKTKHGNFDVNEITYGEQRNLHRYELRSMDIETGKLDVDCWCDLLDHVSELAFGSQEKAQKQLCHLEQAQIDLVLTEIQQFYLTPPKK